MSIFSLPTRVQRMWNYVTLRVVLWVCLNRLKKAITTIEAETEETYTIYKDLIPVAKLLRSIDDRLLNNVSSATMAEIVMNRFGSVNTIGDFNANWQYIKRCHTERVTIPNFLRLTGTSGTVTLNAFARGVGADLVSVKYAVLEYCRFYNDTFDVEKTNQLGDDHFLSNLVRYNEIAFEITNALIEAAFNYE